MSFLLNAFGAGYMNNDFVFRGESVEHTLRFSQIDRLTFNRAHDRREALLYEQQAAQRFWQDARLYLPPSEQQILDSLGGALPLMRHYGAPTRLLDWTESPWIALYFTCASSPKKHGRILGFDRFHLTGAVDSQHKGQTQLASPRKFGEMHVPALLSSDPEELDDWIVCYHHVGPKFPRLMAQQGLFTLGSKPWLDHWETAQQYATRGLEILVRNDQKATCLRRLARMGITAASLFPDAGGVGQAINDDLYSRLNEGRIVSESDTD